MTKTEYFRAEVVRWMDLFGCGRWSVQWDEWDTVLRENPDFELAAACALAEAESRTAKFALNPVIAEQKSDQYVSRCALHEVTHLLTSRLEAFVGDPAIPESVVDEESEAIAKAMERAFFGPVDM